ncbi:IS5 family transposase [Desulfolutivibrio sulfoxidireducens]|nr:IS5 family transposase [Desulfolutivibrio sulfoxidireducens]QLA19586.1 IS5 family transposase [Desulfolutivibrio sulfoxidireducens]QLA20151.1 IS5 family transposase [Desulfolutivibrio sulfoxidireducens]QLA20309.1 IS5 family transposase [Desulfolutivibrio sulfoxidireducens]QLA20717.1 IS5 family transposase [Desulfolutivibrio sulfoxidireducens]
MAQICCNFRQLCYVFSIKMMEAIMNERNSKKPGIADYVVSRRRHKECFLDEIDRLIDWKPFEKLLRKKLSRVANAVGNPAYAPLPMFKILLLQRWYNLSDAAVEECLYDRLSFVRFVRLSLDHDQVPDSSTICRFRQSLLEKNVLKRLLDKLNHQLQRRGILVREGAIVDASVITSSRRPLKVIDILPEDREEDDDEASDVTISYSDDADAAWLRKGNRAYYGYKVHAATDSRDGFLLGGHVTPANHSDTQEFVDILDEIGPMPGGRIYADKGYSSQLNRHVLQARGLADGIMHKAARNRALNPAEKAANRQVSSVRSKVERAFGTLKRGYGFFRTRYLGVPKVELEFLLNAMAFNLKKAALKAAC